MQTRPVQILLVDDDDVDVLAVRRAFKKHKIGNPIHVASDGIEALAILRGEGRPALPSPYLILLDLNMPRMGGLELLRELRGDPALHRATVFVLTTSPSDEDRTRAYDANVAGYIIKTNAGEDFIRVIQLLDSYWMVVEFP